MTTVWERIDAELKARHLQWAWLARALETSDQTVHNWQERGVPTKRHESIAEALGWSVDQLLARNEWAAGERQKREVDSPAKAHEPIASALPDETEVINRLASFLSTMPSAHHQEFMYFMGAFVQSRGTNVHSRAALTALLKLREASLAVVPVAPLPVQASTAMGIATRPQDLLNAQQSADLAASVAAYIDEGGRVAEDVVSSGESARNASDVGLEKLLAEKQKKQAHTNEAKKRGHRGQRPAA